MTAGLLCPLCGAPDLFSLWSETEWRCRSCGAVIRGPLPVPDPEEAAS